MKNANFARGSRKTGESYHSTGCETLGLVVVLHDEMDEGEEHWSHTGGESEEEPAGESHADGNVPDTERYVAEEQDGADERNRHPDRVDPVRDYKSVYMSLT